MSATLGLDIQSGQPVTIGDTERRSGLYVLGKPGTGKSSLLTRMILNDINNGHGVFFIDPHGDAINEISSRSSSPITVLDPEDDNRTFGINLLACHAITSLKQRTDTYTRAYSIFHKLWENEWGPWLQLIIQNTLYVFVENQEYTLAEVPLFYTDPNFRDKLVRNVKYHQDVADFWQESFGKKREVDQQRQIDAALTRVNILLGHQYVKHIVGQEKTTIDFRKIMQESKVIAVRLSANLAADIKKFIGTILVSELLYAVRSRPEGNRTHFSVYVDEFQHFMTDDFATLITEGRKFGVATTIAHQERYGQFADNQKIIGATAATANKVFFQLTTRDAQELAPEFAGMVQATEKQQKQELIFSPRPVEAIWDHGHPDREDVMETRSRYFWIVDLLRKKQQEKYIEFNPALIPAKSDPMAGDLHYHEFDNWSLYRITSEMLKEAITALNKFYLEFMTRKFEGSYPNTNDMPLFIKILELVGGVYGFRATMFPYIPFEKQELLLRAIRQSDSQYLRHLLASAKDVEQELRRYSPRIITWSEEENKKWQKQLQDAIRDLDSGIDDPRIVAKMPREIHYSEVSTVQKFALRLGMSAHEAESLIEWQTLPMTTMERERISELIRVMICVPKSTTQERERATRAYTTYLIHEAMIMHYGLDYNSLPDTVVMNNLQLIAERVVRQVSEMTGFIIYCFAVFPAALHEQPIKIPTEHYTETMKVERTQQDLVNEMAQELINLPRFTAYAKVIQQAGGQQVTLKRKIKTLPPPSDSLYLHAETDPEGFCRPRTQIEKEIGDRRYLWKQSDIAIASVPKLSPEKSRKGIDQAMANSDSSPSPPPNPMQSRNASHSPPSKRRKPPPVQE